MSKAEKISLRNAKKNKLFYFVANVVIYRSRDKRCLILKRHEREKVHPGKYAVPGGKLEWEDLNLKKPTRFNGEVLDFENRLEELLAREVKEEAGIEIKKQLYFINDVVFVRPDEIPVVLVKFAAEYKSGRIKMNENDFTNYAWVNEKEVAKFDCIEGISAEIKQTIKLFSA